MNKQHIKLVLKQNDKIIDSSEFDIDYEDDCYVDNFSETLQNFSEYADSLNKYDVFDRVFDSLVIDEESEVEIDSDFKIQSV